MSKLLPVRSNLSRRSFLKLSGLALLASACQTRRLVPPSSPTAIPPRVTPTPFQPVTDTPAAAASPAAIPAPSAVPTPTPEIEPFFLVDGHVDLAWNALEFGRDPHQSALETRLKEQGTALPALIGECTTGFPDWRLGGFGLLFATIFAIPHANAYPGYAKISYQSPEEAAQVGKQVLDYYHTLVMQDPMLKLIRSRQDLKALQEERQSGKQTIGLVLVMEGADPLVEPEELTAWYDSGLRIVGPAWHGTRYAGGTGDPGPLTELGFRLLDKMASLGMVLDLSHLAEESYLQALDHYSGKMVASHSSPRHFVPGDRFLTDEMIRKLAERDGVIGISLYNAHIQPGWRRGDVRPSLSRVAEVIDYIVQLSGSVNTVALGTDMDGGFGVDSLPLEVDTAAGVGQVGEFLAARGYGTREVESVLMRNWLRVLEAALPAE